MKSSYRLILPLLFISCDVWAMKDVDFDHSNGLDLMRQYSAKYVEADADQKLNLLKENYERLKPSKVTTNPTAIIPKTIHQVWPGNDPIPKNYQYFLETWRKFHPAWQIKIWTEQDLVKENFETMDLYWQARSYQERADIMRYEVLRRYGGLYIDMDVECFANFDELHHKYDFYTNMEPPAVNKTRVSIVNAMIASVPNHPILNQTLANIRQTWGDVEQVFEKRYSNRWSRFARSNHFLAVQRTMYPFADAVFDFLVNKDQEKYKSIILPAGYNVPIYFLNETPVMNFLSRVFRDKAKLYNQIIFQPETMSFHYYDKNNSLMKKYYFSESLFNRNLVKGKIYKLLSIKNKYFLAFQDLFNKSFPDELTYQPHAIIPKTIYLENDLSLGDKDINILVKNWQKKNPGFAVKLVDKQYLQQILPQKINLADSIPLIARFYLLNKNGGAYVDSSFKPASLEEFNYKYSYYGGLASLTSLSSELSMNTGIVASIANGSVIHNVLIEFEDMLAKNTPVDNNKVKSLYLEKAYKYYQLDGKTIVFPEMYFDQKR